MSRNFVWLTRTAAGLLLILVLAAALGVAILLPYCLARWWASIVLLVFVSLLSFLLVSWVGARIAAPLWGATDRLRFANVTAGICTFVFAVSLYWLVLKPSAADVPQPFEDTRYWQLSTGSRIAYTELDPPQGVAVNATPIVYLHGGPGARQGHFDQSIYGELSKQGFRVFLYDQAGSGLSDFLPRVRDYTIERAVEDLEAVRKEIGTDKMILIGHSWGSTLAIKYMTQYPGHVAKVIFHSPGEIWDWPEERDFSRTDWHGEPFPSLRLLAAILLADRNPDAGQNLLPQREAESLMIPDIDAELGSLVCKGDSNRLPEEATRFRAEHFNPGINPYVLLEIAPQTRLAAGDPHAALRSDRTPAILLYPECNYIDWSGALDYRRTLPNVKVFYVPHAGHYIQFEQAELMRRIIVAFLLDQPDVIAPIESDAEPRGSAEPSAGVNGR